MGDPARTAPPAEYTKKAPPTFVARPASKITPSFQTTESGSALAVETVFSAAC